MGDVRYDEAYERVADAADRGVAVRSLSHAEVIQALAAASRAHDPYLANVLATEALNRYRRLAAVFAAVALGTGFVIGARTVLLVFFAVDHHAWDDYLQLTAATVVLLLGGIVGLLAYRSARRRTAHLRA